MIRRPVTLQFTKFTNFDRDMGSFTKESYGYRIYNKDICAYKNWDSPRMFFLNIPNTCEEITHHIKEYHPEFWEIIIAEKEYIFNNRKIIISDSGAPRYV